MPRNLQKISSPSPPPPPPFFIEYLPINFNKLIHVNLSNTASFPMLQPTCTDKIKIHTSYIHTEIPADAK